MKLLVTPRQPANAERRGEEENRRGGERSGEEERRRDSRRREERRGGGERSSVYRVFWESTPLHSHEPVAQVLLASDSVARRQMQDLVNTLKRHTLQLFIGWLHFPH